MKSKMFLVWEYHVKAYYFLLLIKNGVTYSKIILSLLICPWHAVLLKKKKILQWINAREYAEKREPSYTVGGNAN